MPIVERPKNGENAGDGVINHEAIEKRRVGRVEFMLSVNESLHALRLMAANHNHTVAILEALITQAKSLETIPGVKVNYYFNPQIIDFAVEAEEKRYGLVGVAMNEGEEIEIGEGEPRKVAIDETSFEAMAYAREDEIGTIENEDDGYELIDSVDFYIMTERLRNNLSQVALELTEQIQGLLVLVEEIEDYEEEPGIQVDFYLDENGSSYSYFVKKKPPMGFAGVVNGDSN